MTRDRAGLALLALLLGLVLVGGATAGSGAQASPLAKLSHTGSEAQYLSSLGLNPTGFVVQRGTRNYAGPNCPGKGWACTKAHRVLQFTTVGGVNSVVCGASGGSGSVGSSAGSTSETCTIVQVSTSGANNATCNEQTSTTASATMAQTCSITQTSGSGKNTATVTQNLIQGPSACSPPSGSTALQTESGTQTASVIQSGPAGDATANVSQTASQCASTTTTTAASESQTTAQTFTIRQGPVGFDPGSTTPNCPNSGVLGATATQSQHQHGYATTASSGSQSQHADLIGHIDQCSAGHADYSATQTEDQALAPNANVTQTQVGPTHFLGKPAPPRGARVLQRNSCCSFQGVNPTDFCTITQTTSQEGNPTPLATQTEEVSSTVGTSGSCSADVKTNQNGSQSSNSQTGQNVNQTVTCQSQVCTGAQAPTKLVWSGDTSGTYHDGANLAATLTSAGNPVVGQTVQLGVGAENCSATTDGSGVASCPVTLNDTPAPYSASASFSATSSYAASTTDPVPFTVNQAPTTLTYGGDQSVDYHDTATLSAHLVETHHTGTGIGGRTVTFAVSDGTNTQNCSNTTDSNGDASCQFADTLHPGSYTVTATFAGDADYIGSSDAKTFTVYQAPTMLTYNGDVSQDYHDTVTLSAQLVEAHHTGTGIGNEPVTFTVSNGTSSQTCSGTTDASGQASCQLVLTLTPGTGYTAAASFAGDVDYVGSTGSTPFTVTREESAVVYTGATTGDYSDQVTLKGVLTEDAPGGPPLAGRQLVLTLGSGAGAQSCTTGSTDATGAASCKVTINQPAGSYPVTANFAGDTYYQPGSSVPATFNVTPEEDSLSYTGPTYAKKGSSVTLSAKLTSDNGGTGNRTIAFTLGSQSCSGTTSSSGVASCTLKLTQSTGNYTVKSSFAGDSYFEPATSSKSFTIKSS